MELTDAQREIRDTEDLSLLILAPAGCGKTESLALRIQGLLRRQVVTAPRKILAISFTNKAKDNLKERLSRHLSQREFERVWVTNFHGLASTIIRAHGNLLNLPSDTIFPEDYWVKRQCEDTGLHYKRGNAVQALLSKIKREALTDQEVAEKLANSKDEYAIEIEALRQSENRLTHDDLIRLAELILNDERATDLYSNHFGAIIIDEFQDLNHQQYRVIQRLGPARTTFAGDLAQGIFSFAGAAPKEILESIESQCNSSVRFTTSFRSSPAVLNAVNSLRGITGGEELDCALPDLWPNGGLFGVVRFASVDDEAKYIYEFSKYLTQKLPSQRVGIMARAGHRRKWVDQKLGEQKIEHYPWDQSIFDDKTAKTVRDLLLSLKGANLEGRSDLKEVLRENSGLERLHDPDQRRFLSEALGWVTEQIGEGRKTLEIVKGIKTGSNQKLINKPGIHLLNAHLGKGQQFEWVIIAGLEEGAIPYYKARSKDEIEEEARVLSVMLSRARHGLIVTHSNTILTKYRTTKALSPSRYLKDLMKAEPLNSEGISKWFTSVDWSSLAVQD